METDCFVYNSTEILLLCLLTTCSQGTFPGLEKSGGLVYSPYSHPQPECTLKNKIKQNKTNMISLRLMSGKAADLSKPFPSLRTKWPAQRGDQLTRCTTAVYYFNKNNVQDALKDRNQMSIHRCSLRNRMQSVIELTCLKISDEFDLKSTERSQFSIYIKIGTLDWLFFNFQINVLNYNLRQRLKKKKSREY